jgi:hypothetical protein
MEDGQFAMESTDINPSTAAMGWEWFVVVSDLKIQCLFNIRTSKMSAPDRLMV